MKHTEQLQPRAPGSRDIRSGTLNVQDKPVEKPAGRKCCGGGATVSGDSKS